MIPNVTQKKKIGSRSIQCVLKFNESDGFEWFCEIPFNSMWLYKFQRDFIESSATESAASPRMDFILRIETSNCIRKNSDGFPLRTSTSISTFVPDRARKALSVQVIKIFHSHPHPQEFAAVYMLWSTQPSGITRLSVAYSCKTWMYAAKKNINSAILKTMILW